MSSATPSETETLLASGPDDHPSPKADGGRDVPVFIDAFKRNLVWCKSLIALGLGGSLGVETWCMAMGFVQDHGQEGVMDALGRFLRWEKITNVVGVVLVLTATLLYLVGLGKHPVHDRQTGHFRNVDLHKSLTEINFLIIMTLLVLHSLPPTLHTYYTRVSPPSPYSPAWVPYLRSAVLAFTLLVIGSMRRIPKLHYTPMKMGTGFGVNQEPGTRSKQVKKEESNVLDRAGCPIIQFVLLVYVARILKRSMTAETLVLDDLPHLAEEVRKTGYRDALSEKQGTIQLDENDETSTSPPTQKLVTSWQLVKAVWQGRGYVVLTNVVYEAIPQFFGLLQLVALRELIDSFADGPDADKSYAYLMCWLLLIGQAAEVIVQSMTWVREHYLLHLPVRMVLASVLFSKILRTTDARALEAKKDADEANKKQGRSQVMNLLTIDTGTIASLGTYVWSITNSLVNLVIGFWLLWSMLGVSAAVGIGCIPLLSSLTTILAKFIYYCDKSLARARDTRTGAVKEFLSGIKVIKACQHYQRSIQVLTISQLNNFEDYYVRDITRVREAEVEYTLGTLWNVIADQLPVISILVTFVIHTKVFHRTLDASTAFVALTVFNRVKGALSQLPSTLQALLQAKVSLDRLTAYMNQPEIDPPCEDSGGRIICDHATVGWPAGDDLTQASNAFTLKDLNFEPPQGQMTIVCGALGSGKTLFLRGLLGEARVLKGSLLAPRTAPDAVPLNGGGIQRNWTNESWLIDSVAYAPQQAFIRHGTIRDNICFGQPFWKDRYKEALRQSALLPDLELMESGDLTEVGEHGTTLSGGQKARVNLARCIYSRAKTVYMDDILSAVDAHTAQYIFTECFQGALLKGRTFVLVTHHVALCLPAAEFLIVLDNGSVTQACPASDAQIATIPAAPPAPDEGPTEEKAKDDDTDEPAPVARQIYKNEQSASGRVASSHYWLVFKAVGGFWYWLIFAILFIVTRLADIGQSFVLEQWSSDTDPRHLDRNLLNYGLFVSAAVILGGLRWVWLYGIGSTGFVNSMSRKIHAKLITTLVNAPLSFFETTPTGRLMNIFGQDINRIDAFVSDDVGRTVMATLEVFTSILIVCIQTPIMAVFIMVGSLPFYWLSGVLGKVRAELRRLSAVAGSPLITLYHDAIDGVVMIRAFGSNELMQASMLSLINRERNATLADFAVFNWVRAIVQTITSIIVAGTGFALVKTNLSPSEAGFILSFAITASRGLFTLLERYSSLEQTFVSAERIEHYIKSPPQESTSGTIPEKSWPAQGSIQVENFSVRYGQDLPDVLHDVSFNVEPGQRVGLVGATGSGKSTLALSLFRAIEGHEGRIMIDGHDISQIELHVLRKRLNMVAQDGSLGSGTLRDALDITRTKDDYEIYEALRRVHLLPENLDEAELKGNVFASLETFVAVGPEGANFSAGEKQLLCLARALLKKSKILVMDEATSSVDFEMDSKITQTIKECFAGTTMLVIAHRLATIMHYDRVLVLDKGRVLEYGKPVDLMRKEGSAFHALCMAQGDEEYEKLLRMASEDL